VAGSGIGETDKSEMVTVAGPRMQSVQSILKPNGMPGVTGKLALPLWLFDPALLDNCVNNVPTNRSTKRSKFGPSSSAVW